MNHTTPKKPPDFQHTEQVRIKCFCGLWLTAGHYGPDEEPCMMHPEPACQRYIDEDPVEFLRALRMKYSP